MSQLFAQGFERAGVAEGGDQTYQNVARAAQRRRVQADRNAAAAPVAQARGDVAQRLAGPHDFREQRGAFADIALEQLAETAAHGFVGAHAGQLRGLAVEACDVPVAADGAHSLGQRIKDQAVLVR